MHFCSQVATMIVENPLQDRGRGKIDEFEGQRQQIHPQPQQQEQPQKEPQAAVAELESTHAALVVCQQQLAVARASAEQLPAAVGAAASQPTARALREQANAVPWPSVQRMLDGFFTADMAVFAHYMRQHWAAPDPGGPGRVAIDKGLLMTAGAGKMSTNAFVNLYVLRHYLNTSLPMTLVYWGKDEEDRLSGKTQEFFKARRSACRMRLCHILPRPYLAILRDVSPATLMGADGSQLPHSNDTRPPSTC